MVLYLIIITVCAFAIAGVAAFAYSMNFFLALGFTWIGVVLSIIIDGAVCGIARGMPKKCAQHDKKIFTVSLKEKKFYEKLKIRKWKDKIPEIGHFTGFRKNKIADPKSVEYVERFLMEACYGEVGHFFSLFFGFLILLLFPIHKAWLAISIPVAIVNALLNFPTILVLLL
ncbi:MAG: hypothetical protein IIX02_02515, partial [Clostridia bacterium]|nr:hypothetical protein [Clostridia bacterium]